jgi:hypothetical protein
MRAQEGAQDCRSHLCTRVPYFLKLKLNNELAAWLSARMCVLLACAFVIMDWHQNIATICRSKGRVSEANGDPDELQL